ncbi:Cadherin-87A [Armadillidium nasatum]|uniref:Cadherin-87A n=1 Tax=Armadillidium nasatum TaxID=96803 RepID=A0A5N5SU20_9CRUS|nr:Cadherin-87A [Armadillidium nasatum]
MYRIGWLNFVISCLLLKVDLTQGNLPPEFISDLSPPLVKENTPVGTPILTLAAKDHEGGRVRYGLQGSDSLQVDQNSGVVTITKPLDREEKDTLRLVVTAEDEVPGADNNIVRVPLEVVVLDVNDNPPIFSRNTYEVTVPEDASVGDNILKGIILSDVDQVGDVLSVACLDHEKPSQYFDIIPEETTSRSFKGSLVLKKPLSYSMKNLFNLSLVATDGENMVKTPLTIHVKDVQNTPPIFHGSKTGIISEDAPIGSLVMVLQAEDGDVGDPRSIMYELTKNSSGRFSLSPEGATGSTSVSLKVSRGGLDYENPNERKFILLVVAEESLTAQRLSSTATIIVSVTDTNDNPPTFAQEAYTALVSETAAEGTVVASIAASDLDTGRFGTDGIRYSLFGNGAERFVASDPDKTSRVKYSLVGGDPNKLFTIDENSGRIRVSDPKGLDISNMKQNELILTVEANDGSGFSFSQNSC